MAYGSELTAARIAAFHDETLLAWEAGGGPPPPRFPQGVWHGIECNHVCNALVWHDEVRARRSDAPDAEVAACKRAIDRHNAVRLDALELVDATLLELFAGRRADPAARLASETPGALIDRLSLLALQMSHLRRTASWTAARLAPGPPMPGPLKRLASQRHDLSDCLDRLLRELADGQACYHLYGPLRLQAASA